jgi:uncharacterized protein YciI
VTPGGLHHVLFYDYVPDIAERRAPHRDAHLELARLWKEEGRLLMAGVLGDPPHGAALVFQLDDPAAVEAFVEADPYVAAGLVTAWRIEPYKVAV